MTFNNKYKKILSEKLCRLLEKVQVNQGWVDANSVYSNNEEFGSEAYKQLKLYLGEWGTSQVIFDFCRKHIPTEGERLSLHGNLLDIIQISKESLSEEILDYLEALPHSYDVYVDLGQSLRHSFEELEIIDDVKLLNFNGDEAYLNNEKRKKNLSSILDEPILSKDKCYLVLKQKGYISNDLTDKTVIKTYSTLKKILYIGHSTGTIIENKRSLAFFRRGRSDLVCRNTDFEPDRIFKLESTSDLAEYANKLILNSDLKKRVRGGPLANILGGSGNDEGGEFYSWEETNKDFFSLCRKVLSPSVDPIKVEPVNRAIEWAFNALYTQDVNLSFIQSCMALEAILGDNLKSKKGLHETLADRFAYSIGTNNANRRTHRENFLEIYAMRSKIVHGSSTHIQHDKLYLSNWANKVLEYLIKKEIRSL